MTVIPSLFILFASFHYVVDATQRQEDFAVTTARSFASSLHPPRDILTEGGNVFYWDDDTMLFEFSLCHNGTVNGYVIVGGDTSLPPVLEYALEGSPLSTTLNREIDDAHRRRLSENNSTTNSNAHIHRRDYKLYYMNSLEIVARDCSNITDGISGEEYDFNIHRHNKITECQSIKRNVSEAWGNEDVTSSWTTFNQLSTGTRQLIQKRLNDLPPKYNQLKRSDGCIMGCTPVAWAQMTAWYKKNSAIQSIWPGSTCYYNDWPGSATNPPCSEVASTIWDFNQALSTTCDGSTSRDNTAAGHTVFDRMTNPNALWVSRDLTFDLASQIIDAGQSYVFCGTAVWQQGTPTGGHCTTAYGYDTATNAIGVVMGWGAEESNRWVYLGINHPVYKGTYRAKQTGASTSSTSLRGAFNIETSDDYHDILVVGGETIEELL